jgi:hypothetical protein
LLDKLVALLLAGFAVTTRCRVAGPADADALLFFLCLRFVIIEGSECRDSECSSNSTGRKATKNGAAAGAFIREGYGESVETILFHCGLL